MKKRLDDVLRRRARLLALTTDRAPVPGADRPNSSTADGAGQRYGGPLRASTSRGVWS
jgi:hypothetical protein